MLPSYPDSATRRRAERVGRESRSKRLQTLSVDDDTMLRLHIGGYLVELIRCANVLRTNISHVLHC